MLKDIEEVINFDFDSNELFLRALMRKGNLYSSPGTKAQKDFKDKRNRFRGENLRG